MAIGVHPDDIEFGMGSTLAKHINLGHEISILILTDGDRDENGSYIKSNKRREETIRALEILGFKGNPIFLNLPQVTVDQITIGPIEAEITRFQPNRIYSHSRNDRHQDHRKCSYAVLSAGRYINEILLFEVFSVLPDFIPNYIVNFSKELLDLKIKALLQFNSQFKNMPLIEKMVEGMAIKNSFMNYATQSEKIHYSEAFEIAKIVRDNNNI